MGCTSCVKNNKEYEMKNEKESNTDNIEKVNYIKETVNSEYINITQSRNNEIFEFFIDLRTNPNKYIEESKNYGLDEIITTAYNDKLYKNKRMLIQNSFFNLFLDTCTKKFPNSKENILTELENYTQLKDYEKSLYIIINSFENPKDFVWYLLKENQDNALNDILYKNYDLLIVSNDSFSDEIIVYFLFLKKF